MRFRGSQQKFTGGAVRDRHVVFIGHDGLGPLGQLAHAAGLDRWVSVVEKEIGFGRGIAINQRDAEPVIERVLQPGRNPAAQGGTD